MKNISTGKDATDPISAIVSKFNIKAAIFDLDGTMLDNNPFHLKSWLYYLKDKHIDISRENFNKHVSGRTNRDALEYIFSRKMSDEEAHRLTLEKEAVYRRLYEPYIREVNGLSRLLHYFHKHQIKMAIATSGIQPNIDFMFEHLPIKHFFSEVVESSQIKNGKPDPEIYLLTAHKLDINPLNCLVFEDSIPGIISAKSAGMKVVALTTTHTKEELTKADFIIPYFDNLFKTGN